MVMSGSGVEQTPQPNGMDKPGLNDFIINKEPEKVEMDVRKAKRVCPNML